MANTVAYYDTATITAVKSFIVQAPGANPFKTIQSKFTLTLYCKLDRFITVHLNGQADKNELVNFRQNFCLGSALRGRFYEYILEKF